jgi:hypothetical protein
MESAVNKKSRKGQRSGVLTEFTVITKVKPGHEKALREVATGRPEDMGKRDEALRALGTLHEARFVLFDNDTRLEFASSFDGTWDTYINDFATTPVANIFDAIYSHCEGYPGLSNLDAVKDWFMENTVEAVNYTCVYPEATVKDIWKALAVQEAFQEVLDNPEAGQALQHPALKPLLEQAAA